MQCDFNLILAGGQHVHVRLFKSDRLEWGLTLHDGGGRPIGRGKSLSYQEAKRFFQAVETCKPMWRASIVWAALGYELKTRKAIARTVCHPGAFPVHGTA